MRAQLAISILVLAVTAGCVETTAPTPAAPLENVPTNLLKDGRDLRKDLKETDVIEAPEWKLGDWFGHHVFFDGGPEAGIHLQTIVVEDQGTNWFLATDDKETAKLEAAFDIPILGTIKKSDLSSTGFGDAWEPYVFPLKAGATWTKKLKAGDVFGGDEEMTITFEVVYDAAIETPDGNRPGFDILGKTEKGQVLFAYDFVPDIQWYAHFYQYNLDTDDPKDFDFHVMSMGHGAGWKGTYYVDTAKELIQEHHGMAVSEDPTSPPYADPAPYIPFTVAPGSTYVYGFAFSFSYAGAQETLIIDPANKKYEYQTYGPADSEMSGEINVPAVAGDWKIVGVGGGVAAVWGVFLWQLTEQAKTL